MKNKGFTLIELLAVIIILGLLMLVAIPSVTAYIDNSRKEGYVTTAKELIKGATNLVNTGDLDMFDTDTTYYIPSTCIEVETGGSSPYGKFAPAYIVVTYDNDSYNYFWLSRDTASMGVKFITPSNELNAEHIISDIKTSDVTPTIGVGSRSKIKVIKESDCTTMEDETLTDRVTETGERLLVVLPEGKEKSDLVVGDIVKIINEEFYVLGYNQSKDELRLLAKYNLNVGSRTVPGAQTGIQHPQALAASNGGQYSYGGVKFAETAYWLNNVGYGKKYSGNYGFNSNDTNIANIYDSNCNPYKYIQQYVQYFKKNRQKIKSSGILGQEEAYQLTINGYSTMIQTSSFWLNSPSRACSTGCVMVVSKVDQLPITSFDPLHQMGFAAAIFDTTEGVRPVIVI